MPDPTFAFQVTHIDGGARMTRDYPMVPNSEGEEHDHPHHRSLWYSHGAINGIDFWSEGSKAGKIVHDKFLQIKSGADQAEIDHGGNRPTATSSRRSWSAELKWMPWMPSADAAAALAATSSMKTADSGATR